MADNKEIKQASNGEAKPAKVKAKAKKPGIFSKLLKLFKDSKSELKKVTWADKSATTKNTVFVIVTLVIVAVIFGLFDTAFRYIIDFIMDLY